MNCLTRIVVPAMLLALVGSAANAQPEPSLDLTPLQAAEVLDAMSPTNAALVYHQLFMFEDTDLNLASQAFEFEPVDPELLEMSVEDSAKKLADSQDRIERFIWTARLPECDFGLMYRDGWGLLLPQLGKMRSMARVLRADAVRQAGLGELDKAADRVDGMFGIAEHARNDRVLISSLVSIAVAKLATDSAVYLADHQQLTNEGRDMLIARLEAIRDGDDYFRVLDCVTMEYTVTIGWLGKMPEGVRPSEWLGGLTEGQDPQSLAALDRMSREALYADAEKMREYFTRVVSVWNEPDAVSKIDALGSLTGVGAYGETGKLFLASMGRARASELKMLDAIDEALPKLYAYRAPGADKPDATHTPAKM